MSLDVRPYAKALTAAVVAGASFAIPVVDDGLTASEVLGIAVAALTAFGTVWGIPNKDDSGQHQDESVQPPAIDVDLSVDETTRRDAVFVRSVEPTDPTTPQGGVWGGG